MAKYTPKTKPFKHQARATIKAARARNWAFFFEPRLGKSKAALDTVGIWALAGKVKRVLILCPRIAVDVWEAQLEEHYPYNYWAETFEERWAVGATSGEVKTKFFLASREEVFRRTWDGKKNKYRRPKQEELEAWDPEVVIIDESHEYKRPGGVAAQDCWRLVRRLRKRRVRTTKGDEKPMPWVLLLTGTPSAKGYIDLFAPFRIMDETVFGTSAATFKERHVVYGVGRRKWTILKYQREKEILRKMRAHSTSVNAEQAGLANEVFPQVLKVHMPATAKKLYLELADEFIADWEGETISAKNTGVKRLRLLQITGGFLTGGTVVHRAKLEKLEAYAKMLLEQEESVVVYSRFTPEVAAVYDVLQHVGFRAFRVDGTVKAKDRRVATDSLRRKPETPTAISFQYQAGSRAIELVGAAETVYYSTPDGWVDYFQTMKRTQGPNQKRPCRYTHLICPGTVDVSVVKGLQRKEDLHAVMMRDPRKFLYGLIQ